MVAKKSEGDAAVSEQAEDVTEKEKEPVGVRHSSIVNALESCAARGTAEDIATRLELHRVARDGGSTSEAHAKRAVSTTEKALKELEAEGHVWSRERDGKTEYLLESTFPQSKNK